MATSERAKIGFDDDLDTFDPQEWAKTDKTSNDRPTPAQTKAAAEKSGFRSREPVTHAAPQPAPVQQRRRRTGRNVQFNVKLKQETISGLTAIADANEWGLGETLEKALALLEREAGRTKVS